MKAVLERIDKLSPDIWTFWFKPEKRLHFTAGEYTELYLPHSGSDGRGERRWFTISSPPSVPLVSITTRFQPEIARSSSFKRALHRLQPGDEVSLAEPMGDFVLPRDTSIPLLFVAAGIGVTPVHSMMQHLQDTDEQRTVRLLYSAATPAALVFHDTFSNYPMQYTPLLSQADSSWSGERGRLGPNRVLAELAVMESDRALVYLAGPELMIEDLADALNKSGVAKHRLITDFFPGYTQL